MHVQLSGLSIKDCNQTAVCYFRRDMGISLVQLVAAYLQYFELQVSSPLKWMLTPGDYIVFFPEFASSV